LRKSSEVQISKTADGSDTLYNPEYDQHYHSTFGAVQESQHVFIRTGLDYALESFIPGVPGNQRNIDILEVGFGTGLNAFLTLAESEKHGLKVRYTTIEPYPLERTCWEALNYPQLPGMQQYAGKFARLHQCEWDIGEQISPYFMLRKVSSRLEDYTPGPAPFQLVFFDAFGPDAQPELWTEQIFNKLFISLDTGGVFVTYSVKGSVVRALRSAGFTTEKIPGPPGKRHILRAIKI
jgi:tRNA U34 5-methylaminomethyl-2-thiouridine-forming methyltransferase MnmC